MKRSLRQGGDGAGGVGQGGRKGVVGRKPFLIHVDAN